METYPQKSILEDKQVETELTGLQLIVSHNYWFKKRLLFNILVGISGLFPTVFFFLQSPLFNLVGIAMWGVVANIFYSVGYVIESFVIIKSKGKKDLKALRNPLFWLGTLAYIIVTIAFGMIYFMELPD